MSCVTIVVVVLGVIVAFFMVSKQLTFVGICFHYVLFPILTSTSQFFYGVKNETTFMNYCIHPLLNITISCEHIALEWILRSLRRSETKSSRYLLPFSRYVVVFS